MNDLRLTDADGNEITVTAEDSTCESEVLWSIHGLMTARDLIALGAFLAECEKGEALSLHELLEAHRNREHFTEINGSGDER